MKEGKGEIEVSSLQEGINLAASSEEPQCVKLGEVATEFEGGLKVVARGWIIDPEQPETKAVSLDEQVQVVAEARREAQEATARRQSVYQEWLEEYQTFFDSESKTRGICQEAETLLRELTLKAYKETGSKNPAPGVGIREIDKLEYDQVVALKWGIDHAIALKLDTAAFEKIVKATPLDFVKITTEPMATIATNLDEVGKS